MNTMPYAGKATQSKYQWMRFTTVQSHTVPSFDPSSPAKSADMYPAAFVDPADPYKSHEWLFQKENDGGIICYDTRTCTCHNEGQQCGCITPNPVCNGFVTSINAGGPFGDGGPGKKPWYSLPSAATVNGEVGGGSSRHDPCPTYVDQVPGPGRDHPCHDIEKSCPNMHCYCGGLTIGNVDLYGLGKPEDQENYQDTNVAGVLIPAGESDCNSKFCAGAKYVSEISDECFKPSNYATYDTPQKIYSTPSTVYVPRIENTPSALEAGDPYNPKDPTKYDVAIAETTGDLYNASNGSGSFVAGKGSLLYFPPLYDSNFMPWFTSFTNKVGSTYVKTGGSWDESPTLPQCATYLVSILAYASIVPRYMMLQAFNLYGVSADTASITKGTFQNPIFAILQPNTLEGAISDIKKFGDYLGITFETQRRQGIFKTLQDITTSLFYGTGGKSFIRPVQLSDQADKGIGMGLEITIPTDIAVNWGITSNKLSDEAVKGLQYFFGETQNGVLTTDFVLDGGPTYYQLVYSYTNGAETLKLTHTDQSPPAGYSQTFPSDAKNIPNFTFNLATTFTLAIRNPSIVVLGYIMKYGGGVAQDAICGSGDTGAQTLERLQTVPVACLGDMAEYEKVSLQEKLKDYCSEENSDASKYPRSTGLDDFMVTGNNPVCVCYNSYIGPPQDRNPDTTSRISLCFARACAEGLGQVDVRDVFDLSNTDCQSECATLKGWFGDSLYSVNPDELDTGRVKLLCNFTPMSQVKELYNTTATPLILTLGVTICIAAYTLIVVFKGNKKIGAIVLASFLILFVGLGGILLARKDTECEKRSTDPGKRKQDCPTRMGLRLPEIMCKPALDHCECGWTDIGNTECPIGCECKGTGCQPLVSTPVTYYRQRSKGMIALYVCASVISLVFLMVLNLKYNRESNKATIVLSVVAFGGIVTGLMFAVAGRKRPKSIFGCSPPSPSPSPSPSRK